jgi:UDP-N-acetyl-D-mannosaminuronic acid dehydrogenase
MERRLCQVSRTVSTHILQLIEKSTVGGEDEEVETYRGRVAVVGVGFIGLPLALSFAQRGVEVVGVDANAQLVEALNAGRTELLEHDGDRSAQEILREALAAGRFQATTSYPAAREADAYIVTVGVPIRGRVPDFAELDACCVALARVLKRGDLVVIRSTVVPGTTKGRVVPILQSVSGLVAGVDFDLAYASERIAEGRAFEEFRTMPLAVGGLTERATERAMALLAVVTEAPMTVADIRVVETAKVIENVQRDVNVAMMQEVARLAAGIGVDTYELVRVANTHRRVELLLPGPGVGGYCLPNALYYLLPEARRVGVELPLLVMARAVNDGVPGRVVGLVGAELAGVGKGLVGARVGVLGLAMKDYSNDDRLSPPHVICEGLVAAGAEVRAFDPAVPRRAGYQVEWLEEAIEGADIVLLLAMQTAFDALDWSSVADHLASDAVIIDTRNRIRLPHDPHPHGRPIRLVRF